MTVEVLRKRYSHKKPK